MIMRSMLHFSFDFGLHMLGKGIWYLGMRLCCAMPVEFYMMAGHWDGMEGGI